MPSVTPRSLRRLHWVMVPGLLADGLLAMPANLMDLRFSKLQAASNKRLTAGLGWYRINLERNKYEKKIKRN